MGFNANSMAAGLINDLFFKSDKDGISRDIKFELEVNCK